MDWYAWLCRVGLHPDVAFEYALLFARNELGAADVRHLDHEFLLSMGVAVAKHRLEILKLARKDSSSSHRNKAAAITTVLPWRATRLLAAAVHRSARSALARLRASVSRRRDRDRDRDRDRAAAVLATQRLPLLRHRGGRVAHRHSSWSKVAPPVATIRTGGKLLVKTLPAPAASIAACLVSTDDVCSCDEDAMDGGEEMRWESMFQDLKPT